MLPATIISLLRNIKLTDLDSFVRGDVYGTGSTKQYEGLLNTKDAYEHILIVDDSILNGRAMENARSRVGTSTIEGRRITYCAVYGPKERHPQADLVLEAVPTPRVFQWNFMHHAVLENSCVDIDGVLCDDPLPHQNDDGDQYVDFLQSAAKYISPTRPIHSLVTNRLEKYRGETETWLQASGISYGKLHMLDLPTKEDRISKEVNGAFKADVYRESKAELFIESELRQAIEIAQLSGKPVLCIETHEMVMPHGVTTRYLAEAIRRKGNSSRGKLMLKMRRLARGALGSRYNTLARWWKSRDETTK
ncbi:phosphoribosyltransferase [Antarcticirhabdus aurantiaca]|uniref:Phosphoribosyltransferase n=1 Tax=Antarcticirhabdus aurantiaca TaxID=2606717 RepID=A0ACD4NJR2_9HYPH|nr:phosphoribosyltransferase [Antarcticirhabdus aurantiaca]WAJ27045.1 phosphoribosyltransferase [Jeongeuplla avenae]